jgi:hypothetical protein
LRGLVQLRDHGQRPFPRPFRLLADRRPTDGAIQCTPCHPGREWREKTPGLVLGADLLRNQSAFHSILRAAAGTAKSSLKEQPEDVTRPYHTVV